MLNEKSLNLAGWLSVVAAALYFPQIIIGLISELSADKSKTFLYLEALLNTGFIVIYVYIFVMLKRLLNEKAAFHDADKYITFLVWTNVVITVISVIALPFPEAQEVVGAGIIYLMVPLGVIYVVFGIKLLNCEDNLFGYLKPFSYLTIATGIMTAVVVLVFFGFITAIISDIILALIFFKAANLMQTQGSISSKKA